MNFSFNFDREYNICTRYSLEICSADVYYKYDFAKKENIGTSFATDQNSVSLGMLIALKKLQSLFCGRFPSVQGQFQSIPNGDGTDLNSFHIQNLYATCAATDKLSFTAGYMGTLLGMR
jgi:hypothetical protein